MVENCKMAFSRVPTKYELRDLYREYIFPDGEFNREETARRMVDPDGRRLDDQLAVAELHSAKSQLETGRHKAATTAFSGDTMSRATLLIGTANRAIQCATDAENSGIRAAIDTSIHLCKVVNTILYLVEHDTTSQLDIANYSMTMVNNYITGTVAPPAPMTFEEALEFVGNQPEDFPVFFPEV